MKKFGTKKIIIYACAFLIPFAMLQVFFALCGLAPFGGSSILTGDMDIEFVNFYSYFRNLFSTKNDLSYMFAKTLGGDFPGLAAFLLHEPLMFLLFLFPGDNIALGVQYMFAVQLSIAGLSASILLNERYKCSWTSLLFSTAYSFSAFFFGYLVLTIYFGCLAILPLVIYFFLEFLEDKRSSIPFILTTALFIYINYHMGFMLVIFLLLFYVSRLIVDPSRIKKLVPFIRAGVIVLLIDGLTLIRTGLSLIGEKTTDTADYGIYRRFAMNQVFANLFSGSTRNQLMPLIYCSMAALFFALIFFMMPKFSLREKLADLFLLAALFVSMWINALDAVWHGFNNPEEFYWRYAYFISLTLVAAGYRGFTVFTEDGEERKRRSLMAVAGFLILMGYIGWAIISNNAYLDRERQIVNAVIICLITVSALLLCRGGKLTIIGFALLASVSVPDMLYDAKVTYIKLNADDGELPLMADFKEDYRRIGEAVGYVKSQDDGFYRLEKDFDRAVNDPAMFDYIGLSHDSSCEKDEILDYLTNFGFRKTVYYTYYNGGSTSFADAFFGVRYLISMHDGINKPYEYMTTAGDYGVFRDPYALPMAYIAPDGLAAHTFEDENTFEKQNKLAAYWGTEKPLYIKADCEQSLTGVSEDGEGHFVRTEDEGFIVYNINVTENMPLYFYFAAPHMQSGEVFVNGESRGWYFTENRWNVLCAGIFEPGENVEIKMQLLKEELDISEPCFYYEDRQALEEWADRASEYNEKIGETEEITSSHLKLTAQTEEGQEVILSMPYDDGWKIKCDGKSIKPEPAIEQLMGIRLPEGQHEIEMKYVPHGTVAGTIVSICGLLLLAVEIRIQRKRSGQQAASDSDQV